MLSTALQELREILRIEEQGKEEAWRDLADALHADIKVRSEGLLGFVYSAFRLAVERRYLRSPEDVKRVQVCLPKQPCKHCKRALTYSKETY